ncbi:MAG TPA: hypothetical protein VM536_01100, partial [Chloroflexia bacterium]|nr:hypothetical protein [Chloroflexia bacterium]
AYSPGGHALGRVYYVNLERLAYDADALLGLLNSRLLRWYYRFLYWPVHLSGGYLRFNAPYLARLPLPAPSEIPAALPALARAAADHPEARSAIDELVCGLYRVTEDELAAAEAVQAAG